MGKYLGKSMNKSVEHVVKSVSWHYVCQCKSVT